ncbi:preprotein translocase subunit YajC [Lawsonia intracellularis]|uniref:Sec translocon accessory complex subunit YajC n=1 Tax=Lawsonia intracellularis (strain PHE/MN1-00) TaxID=363253 RepID=Q1MSC0_LAWIP|nr:preprotein translocase subunit YajC [Lawsonia intracellularis]AGC49449.1 preprotein translocase subunit YajC [Lawsonia intracellularis N343]KAA0204966.1 preprotein translocase subunit YajC [Lawsonia intracellularis]MBZ3892511.1 preprotein translocase subunit YajC [Lawsonia intracellularis]OMQ06110.1 preprotein translocase subunit YajC [Lawsonia intracellularis]RBN32485.1 preprotein translocase subunit YajC [Lawsonia intracellularis]
MISIAHAFGTPDPSSGEPSNVFMQFIPLIIMLAIFYFLLIRPQQKRTKQHKAMLQALKKGDHILSTGGLIGRIVDIDGDTITTDLGHTTVQINRAYVVGLVDQKGSLTKEEK